MSAKAGTSESDRYPFGVVPVDYIDTIIAVADESNATVGIVLTSKSYLNLSLDLSYCVRQPGLTRPDS